MSTPTIKAVFFDLGGVILNHDAMVRRALKVFKPADEAAFRSSLHFLSFPLSKGDVSIEEFWVRVAQEFNPLVSTQDFEGLWIDDYRADVGVNDAVFSLLKELKPHYPLGLISNTIKEHAEVAKDLGVLDPFDALILSYEVRAAKPMREIFDLALRRLNVAPHESVFIDDVPKFADAARSAGMHAINFENAVQLRTALAALGISLSCEHF